MVQLCCTCMTRNSWFSEFSYLLFKSLKHTHHVILFRLVLNTGLILPIFCTRIFIHLTMDS